MTTLQKVLIVDASRLVRASLSKLLRGHFDVCEERDGESAWQTLVLDSSIIAVFSGLDILTLEGAGLVERLRASKLARLNQLPFFLLISDSFAESGRQPALQLGVSEFIPKKTAGPEFQKLLLRLIKPDLAIPGGAPDFGEQSEVGINDLKVHVDSLPDLSGDAGLAEPTRPVPEGDDLCLADSLSSVSLARQRGVLVFGLDGYEGFRLNYGWDLADKIVQKILGLLASKIHSDETMLPLVGGRIAIISALAGREQCEKFARDVCRTLSAANISICGIRVPVTVSVGIAALPDDQAATTTDELLHLAISRHDAAHQAGGNRVISMTGCGGTSINQEIFFERLKEMLADESPTTLMSCKGWLTAVCKKCRTLRAAGEAPLCAIGDVEENC
ncbi:MAG: diguanylate cyclase [Gammaproteobacteria bacterium]|nr:diguanylate cyclase [Gammaproteobacteria bacterium]MBU1602215.1 diguanylate cyclase [Gammaproteobacteria bacterium]MBU2434262.1 diguanylate cyclase [Gammaproteobacteria bacterium]MBU2448413.1 diguanylate cyclase [Gammaproteobacteria bacterium]